MKKSFVAKHKRRIKSIISVITVLIGLIAGGITICDILCSSPKTVVGIVRDSSTNKTISRVTVMLDAKKFTTGDDGIYYFEKSINEGRHQIFARKIGYKEFSNVIKVENDDVEKEIIITSSDSLMGKIVDPKEYKSVAQSINVKGYISNKLRKGQYLWTVVHPADSKGWWPQIDNLSVSPIDGRWAVEVTLGKEQDVDKYFVIALVIANQSAHESFGRYLEDAKKVDIFPDKALPDGVKHLDNVIVVRQ